MRLADFAAGVLRAVTRERARVALTILGIAVGTFAVATLISLGAAIQRVLLGSLRSLGENLVIVTAEPPRPGLVGGPAGRDVRPSSRLSERDLAVVRGLPSVEAAAAVVATPCNATVGSLAVATTCVGADPEYLDVARIALEQGAEFSAAAAVAPRAEAILGATVARRLGEGIAHADLLGAPLQVAGRRVRVTGVARARGNGVGGADEDDFILVPETFARQQLVRRAMPEEVDALFVLARPGARVEAARADIEDSLARRRHIDSVRGVISVSSLAGLMATSLQASDLLTLLLAGMAAISVLVGGVGIVNVMLTNVAERRLEIGLKLAIGAAPDLIAAEFLAQAVVLSLLGALLGLAGAEVVALLLTAARGFDVALTPAAAGLSLALAMGVGVFAGAWPADRAARLQPREILRDA